MNTSETATSVSATEGSPAVAGAGTAAADVASNVLATFSENLAEAVERTGRSVVRVDARRRRPASGVVWRAEGLIVTADHVLEQDEDVSVGLPNGDTVPAAIVGRDASSDLALLRVAASGLVPIQRGPAPRVGHVAMVVARPGRGVATSIGVVSALGGPVRRWRGGGLEGVIWTDAGFYPGFSGAPLVDTAGRMVGLATSNSGGRSGLAIPLVTLERVTASLQSDGRIKRGFLGINGQPVALPEAFRSRLGLSQESGLLLVGLEPGGPAERGGLLIGDVLVSVSGQPVRDTEDLLAQLGPERVNQTTPLRVVRGGETHEASVTIGERE